MKTNREISEYLFNVYSDDAENILLFDNYDYADAFIGITQDNRAVYDYELMIEYLVNNHSFTFEEAIEWIDYNTLGVLEIENSPIILFKI